VTPAGTEGTEEAARTAAPRQRRHMNRSIVTSVCAMLSITSLTFGATTMPALKVPDKVKFVSRAFEPGEVAILPGVFKDAEQADLKYLLSLEPDRLLAGFRIEAGLKPKAEKYGGWESRGVAGHSLGHWLTACALMYAQTHDERLVEKVNYTIDQLAEVQQASDGALIAFPDGRKIFAEVAAGDVRSQGFDLNGGWVPWYTIHKELAGLIDVYRYMNSPKALEIATKKADWAIAVTAKLALEQWQLMLGCEHGGMNESLAELYAITGEKKYEDLARKFHHDKVLTPLAEGRDVLPGLHANTQIPKLIGLARLYELDGNEDDRKAASFFWNTVVDTQTFANGGNSTGEHFGKPNMLGARLAGDTAETCNTYNMLKLARHLYEWESDTKQQMKLADYIERATFNHILASQDPKTGMVIYFCRVGQGVKKDFSTPFDSFWCCVGTGMENHAKYADSIYFKSDDTLTTNQFIASEVKWSEHALTVRQETRFPDEPKTTFTFTGPRSATPLTLRLRYPNWAVGDAKVMINGEAIATTGKPGSYIELKRVWNNGDRVELALPMSLHAEPLPDIATREAMFIGPILLAANVPEKKIDHPVVIDNDKPLDTWLKPQGELMFTTADVAKPTQIEFKPFFRLREGKYTVYFDRFTQDQWDAKQAAYRAEQERVAALEARTVDRLDIGEMQPERDHELVSEKSITGENGDRKWRHATDGGFFEFTMKVDPVAKNELVVTYWGGDENKREFDLIVDGQTVGSESLNASKPGEYFDKAYAIDPALTKGKTSVKVRVQAHPKRTAGGVYGVRIIKAE
jgi:uncharacterized protein